METGTIIIVALFAGVLLMGALQLWQRWTQRRRK